MAGITLTGMASGLDTDTIISQLMAIEQQKVTNVQKRQITVQAHHDDLSAIKTKVDAVKSAVAALADTATWKATQTTNSSDPTKLDVTLLGGAGIGGHSVQVDKLASSAQHGFSFTPSATAGSVDLYFGSDPAATGASKVTIAVPANATASDFATAVNANENAPVYAAVVNDGTADRIVFSARKTGTSSDFSVDSSALSGGSQMSELPVYSRTGATLNAQYHLDGDAATLTSESNVVDNAIPGVRLTLKGVSASPVTINTTQAAIDSAAVTKKVQTLVDAYNSVVDATRTQLAEKSVPTAATSADLQKGTLFGDSGLNSMLGQLKSQMTQAISGLGLTSLADIGITVPKSTGGASSDDAKAGKLVFDSSKLTTTMNADWTKVRDLFTGKGTTKGLASKISDFVGTQTGTGGVLTGRMTSDDTSLKGFTDQITDLNTRMDAEQARLKTQFAKMESALQQSQTQQAWLTSQIASLP